MQTKKSPVTVQTQTCQHFSEMVMMRDIYYPSSPPTFSTSPDVEEVGGAGGGIF